MSKWAMLLGVHVPRVPIDPPETAEETAWWEGEAGPAAKGTITRGFALLCGAMVVFSVVGSWREHNGDWLKTILWIVGLTWGLLRMRGELDHGSGRRSAILKRRFRDAMLAEETSSGPGAA